MAVTLVWRTDVHLSDRTPRSRKDNWTQTVLGKLRQVGRIAREVKADAVLDGGDFFDVKSPQRNSHALVRATAEVHKDYPCPVYANVGNHDCVYGDYAFLPQQPLGVLFATGVFKPCYDEHEAEFTASDGTVVRVVGVPYHGTKYDLDRIAKIRKGEEDFLVIMCHMLASPTGGSMFEGEDIIRYSDLRSHDADVFCFGHWHKDQGVVENGYGQYIVNVGSLSRGSLSQDDMDRQPACVVLRFEKNIGVTFDRRNLEVTPAAEVFDVEARTRQEERSTAVDSFVDSIKDTLTATQSLPLADLVRQMDVPSDVKETALLYLEEA